MIPSLQDMFSAIGFTLSLPERLARSLAATVGGASKILTDTLIPEPLRKTHTYTAIVGNAQRFLIEKIAEVQGAYQQADAASLPEDYVQRAVAGNILSTVGVMSVHLSPLWVFALAADVAQGSKVYLHRLVKELKDSHVISPDAQIKEVDELLDSLGRAGRDTAQVFDMPPVELGQIRELRDRLTAGYTSVFKEAGDLLPRIDTLWEKMEALARRDNVAVESIVGLMTVDLNRAAGKAIDAAFAVGSATTDLLSETILQSYGETIQRVQTQGAVACLEEASRPYLQAIGSHLGMEKQTWTERTLQRGLSSLLGTASSSAPESPAAAPPPPGEPPAGAV
jgi:hypothetical protein